jgi:phage tail-like protein
MSDLPVPFRAFDFLISVTGPGGVETILGGFSEATVPPAKLPGIHSVGDVTMKRGVVQSQELSDWIGAARSTGQAGRRDVTIVERDELREPVRSWRLVGALPIKYTGPVLRDGGGEVAIEELVLSFEHIELVPTD